MLVVTCLAALASACLAYTPPQAQQQVIARSVEATQEALFEAAMATIVGAGYRVALTDRARGLISTNRPLSLLLIPLPRINSERELAKVSSFLLVTVSP